MSAPAVTADTPADDLDILVVRRGPGANCSSIGSAVEMLFLSAAAGAALVVAASAALRPRADDADDDTDDEGDGDEAMVKTVDDPDAGPRG